ncbi:MAG: hypothetical protein SH820_16700 [Xanthomonadales bacterium]|nr:hypothetical protein [Xanthomonadales bacterium]
MMKQTRKNQLGGSAPGNILLIALFAYGVYLGIQYVPQLIESKSLDSMLDSIESQNRSQPYASAQQVEQAVKSILNLNQMDEMINNITIRAGQQGINIEVGYERELNLLFQKKAMSYNKSLDLN